MERWVTGGTYLRTISSDTIDIYFPLSGDTNAWVDSDGLAKFEKAECY